jgi:UPF0755 protein
MIGRTFRFLVRALFLALVVGVLAAGIYLGAARSPGPLTTAHIVLIEPGTGTRGMARLLMERGVLSSEGSFLFAVLARGAMGDLRAGEYEFAPRISAFGVIDQLKSGNVVQRRLTIAEGLTVAEIIAVLNQTDGLTGTVDTIPQEGRLLPETYNYTWGTSRQSLINRMITAMDKVVTPLWATRPPEFPLKSINDVLTLASIIEKETGVANERPMIASVFFNRLQTGMKLQSDPTVIYAITNGTGPLGRALLTKDLEGADSPYNTYKYGGLPPGAIANPGAAAIRAVFAPAQTDYFYFVADGTGGHVFSRNLKEHNDNVARWRKLQKQMKTEG